MDAWLKERQGILAKVKTPGQYIGMEPNRVDKPDALYRAVMAFPEPYTIGMSHHGSRILYERVNALPDWACERAFAPWLDYEQELRKASLPLTTLETRQPLSSMDLVLVSLQHELTITGVLTMLDLGGIPLLASERGEADPLVVAGGHAAMNPEPYAEIFDVFVIGEGEEAVAEIAQCVAASRSIAGGRGDLLRRLSTEVEGCYVPSLYETTLSEAGEVVVETARAGAPETIRRRIFHGFSSSSDPQAPVVPVVEAVHERVTLEVMRGCPNGCRFCQAGMICRPVRERPVDSLLETARTACRHTGFDDIGLLSLSTSDYSRFDALLQALDDEFAPQGVGISVPSLRVDQALSGIPKRLKSVRKSGLTIAPEAGSDRLRAAINKHVTNEDLLSAVDEAFAQGWKAVKLYFMVGLPTETDEDVAAIADLCTQAARLRRGKGRGPAITCSVSNFVPKAHTPFQWEAMVRPEELARRHGLIASGLNLRTVRLKAHDPQTSRLEGILARGDRRLSEVILDAWRQGARFEAWDDCLRLDLWSSALLRCEVDGDALVGRRWSLEERLPWQHIDSGVSLDFLKREKERCAQAERTAACSSDSCAGCGVEGCSFLRPA